MDSYTYTCVDDLQLHDKRQYKSTRNWVGVLYPENMLPDWQNRIFRLLQVPFCYIIHDSDEIEFDDDIFGYEHHPRKTHVHMIIHYGNTTTYQSALDTFSVLSALGKRCINTCQPVRNLSYMYQYLTHSTPDSSNKFQYNKDLIVTGNNFDIQAFLEIQEEDLSNCLSDISMYLIQKGICTYTGVIKNNNKTNFVEEILKNYDINLTGFRFIMKYRTFISEICKGNYLDKQAKIEERKEAKENKP